MQPDIRTPDDTQLRHSIQTRVLQRPGRADQRLSDPRCGHRYDRHQLPRLSGPGQAAHAQSDQRTPRCHGHIGHPHRRLPSAVLSIFLHDGTPRRLRPIFLVLDVRVSDRLHADDIPHGVHLADRLLGGAPIRRRLPPGEGSRLVQRQIGGRHCCYDLLPGHCVAIVPILRGFLRTGPSGFQTSFTGMRNRS